MGEQPGAEAAGGSTERDRGEHIGDDGLANFEWNHVAHIDERGRQDGAHRRAGDDSCREQEIKVGGDC